MTTISLYNVINLSSHTKESIFPFSYQHPAISKGIDFLKTKMDENGCIISVSVTAWAAIAIASSGDNLSKWEKTRQCLIDSVGRLNRSIATDYERHCLALVSFGEDPRNVNGIDLVNTIKDFYHNGQIGFENNSYDDMFGIIALRSCGVTSDDEIIQNCILHILKGQYPNGGWGDVDTTAAAIISLTAYDSIDTQHHVQKAISFLRTQQTNTGGFFSWGTSNSASTSWAICSIVSAQENPNDYAWKKNNCSPVDFLLMLQQSDGSFLYSEDTSMNPEWMTAYVIIALTGGTFLSRT